MTPTETNERTPVQASLESFQQAQLSYRETIGHLQEFLLKSQDFFAQDHLVVQQAEVLQELSYFGLYNQIIEIFTQLQPNWQVLEIATRIFHKLDHQHQHDFAQHFLTHYGPLAQDFFTREFEFLQTGHTSKRVLFLINMTMRDLVNAGYAGEIITLLFRLEPRSGVLLKGFEQTITACAFSHFDEIRELISLCQQTDQDQRTAKALEKVIFDSLMEHFTDDQDENQTNLDTSETLASLKNCIDRHEFTTTQLLAIRNSIDYLARHHFPLFEKVCKAHRKLIKGKEPTHVRVLFALYSVVGPQKAREFLVKNKLMNDLIESHFIELDLYHHHYETIEDRLNAIQLELVESLELTDNICSFGHTRLAWNFFTRVLNNQPNDVLNTVFGTDVFSMIRTFFSLDPETVWKFFMADQRKLRASPLKMYQFMQMALTNGLDEKVWRYLKNSGKMPVTLPTEFVATLLEKIWHIRPDLQTEILSWIKRLPDTLHKTQLESVITDPSAPPATDLTKLNESSKRYQTELRNDLIPNELEGMETLYKIMDQYSPNRETVLPIVSSAMRSAANAKKHLENALATLGLPELCMLEILSGNVDLRGRESLITNVNYQRITLTKSGSEARVWTNGVIENKIDSAPYKIWKTVHDVHGIPVAPIFGAVKSKDHQIRVLSRYCGLSVSQMRFLSSLTTEWYWSEIEKQMASIKRALERVGISHNHPHQKNFTVEYVRKSVYQANHNPNTMYYSAHDLHFDPVRFFESPDEWVIQVRLIDWDAASYTAALHTPS